MCFMYLKLKSQKQKQNKQKSQYSLSQVPWHERLRSRNADTWMNGNARVHTYLEESGCIRRIAPFSR